MVPMSLWSGVGHNAFFRGHNTGDLLYQGNVVYTILNRYIPGSKAAGLPIGFIGLISVPDTPF